MGDKTLIRLNAIRKADRTDDQKTPVEIASALTTSETQEDLQEFLLSQVKRIIFGDATGNWNEDFDAAGVRDLKYLSSSTGGTGAIQIVFDASDAPGPVTVGTVPSGRTIEKVVLEVLVPFDTGFQVTVGDDSAMGRLMAVADSRLDTDAEFRAESGYLCPSDVDVRVYYVGVTPTVGSGRVIVYFA